MHSTLYHSTLYQITLPWPYPTCGCCPDSLSHYFIIYFIIHALFTLILCYILISISFYINHYLRFGFIYINNHLTWQLRLQSCEKHPIFENIAVNVSHCTRSPLKNIARYKIRGSFLSVGGVISLSWTERFMLDYIYYIVIHTHPIYQLMNSEHHIR